MWYQCQQCILERDITLNINFHFNKPLVARSYRIALQNVLLPYIKSSLQFWWVYLVETLTHPKIWIKFVKLKISIYREGNVISDKDYSCWEQDCVELASLEEQKDFVSLL